MQSGVSSFLAEPNKLCDVIAAGIVDEYQKRDPDSRLNLSVTGGHGALFVAGELLSKADFDVSAVVKRILGRYGIPEGIEPFIALEKIPSERVMHAKQAAIDPLLAFGYATNESPLKIPKAQEIAIQISQAMEEKRTQDPDWFWMSRVGSVVVNQLHGIYGIQIRLDHGSQDLGTVREQISKLVEKLPLPDKYQLHINTLGATDGHSLKSAIGKSNSFLNPYGLSLPSIPAINGLDWHKAQVASPIIARHLANQALQQTGAQAVMVRLLYLPGEDEPAKIWIRSESGRDLSDFTKASDLHLQKRMDAWKQSDLMTQIAIHGIAGHSNLPWEDVSE